MGFTLTDVLLFGGAKESDADNAAFVIMRRNILRWGAIGGYVSIVVHGVPPLVLPDAIANSLSYVKAFGGTEQNGTPTPDAPVDIVSNNGVLKVRHQSGLPLGYTLLEYIKTTGTQYIDTGINGSQITRFVVKGTCAPKGSSNTQLLGSTNATATTFFGARVLGGAINWYCFDGTKSLGNPTNLSIIDCAIESASSQPGTLTDTTTGVTQTFIKLASSNWGFGSANLLLFGGDVNRTSNNATCCYLQLYTSGGLAFSGVPCMRNSDNVVGMYDLVSGQFFTNAGTGDFVAGETVDDIEVYADGTTETINVHGKNLLNPANIEENIATYYTDFPTNGRVGYHLSLKAGTYTYSVGSEESTTYLRYKYNGQEWSAYASIRNNGTTQTYTNDVEIAIYSGSSGNNIENMLGRNVQVEQGSTATEYEPYYDGGTATAEMLLKVGDYQDVQSILDGVVTRNVGVKVFDGTEGWAASTVSSGRLVFYVTKVSVGSDSTVLPNGSPNIKCSHFETSTAAAQSLYGTVWAGGTAINFTAGDFCANLTAWKQWLADQYAAGTPVIVVYPLATPTTESVTGQTLQVQDGDNTLEITQASLDGLELEAKYNAAVSLTIQEVQDANLDNNVTVTIQ